MWRFLAVFLIAHASVFAQSEDSLTPLGNLPRNFLTAPKSLLDLDDLEIVRSANPYLFCNGTSLLSSADTAYRSAVETWVRADETNLKDYLKDASKKSDRILKGLAQTADQELVLWEIAFRFPFTEEAERAVRGLIRIAYDRNELILARALSFYPGRPFNREKGILSAQMLAKLDELTLAAPDEKLLTVMEWRPNRSKREKENWRRLFRLLGPTVFESLGLPAWLDGVGCDVVTELAASEEYEGTSAGVERLYSNLFSRRHELQERVLFPLFMGKFATNNILTSGVSSEEPASFDLLLDQTERRALGRFWMESLSLRPAATSTQFSLYRFRELLANESLDASDPGLLLPIFNFLTHPKIRQSGDSATSGILPAFFPILDLVRDAHPRLVEALAVLVLDKLHREMRLNGVAVRDRDIIHRIVSYLPDEGAGKYVSYLVTHGTRFTLQDAFAQATSVQMKRRLLGTLRNLGPQASASIPFLLDLLEKEKVTEHGESELALEILESWTLIPEDGTADPKQLLAAFSRLVAHMKSKRTVFPKQHLVTKATDLLRLYPKDVELFESCFKDFGSHLRDDTLRYGVIQSAMLADKLDFARKRLALEKSGK